MRRILNANCVELDELHESRLEQTEAVTGFLEGRLDCLVFVPRNTSRWL